MGSKKLKAVVVRGTMEIPVSDKAAVVRVSQEHVKFMRIRGPSGMSLIDRMQKYGTSYTTYESAHSGDSPVKNWGGIGVIDLPDISGLHHDVFADRVEKGHGCWHCPLRCKAILKAGTGEYNYAAGSHRPEYETAGAFGALCANSNTESIIMANDICNRSGLDTISAGSVIAFATELYENGILSKKDTDGIDLKWGNHRAMVAMTEKLAKREGVGDILADGVKKAAEKIGRGAEQFAMHIGGQEVAMHSPLINATGPWYTAAARYQVDATPGRHTVLFGPFSFVHNHFLDMTGLCHFGQWPENPELMAGIFNAVTGWNFSWRDMAEAGERIVNLRQAFNLREGINELKRPVPGRIVGKPPQTIGPLAGVTSDIEAQVYWCLGALDWDRVTTKPSKAKLVALGLDDVAKDLWP
jgi:aldehyde:ferredoxin oxidoreductase